LLADQQFVSTQELATLPKDWFDFNSFLKIGDTGLVTIYLPIQNLAKT
jgi:hypothetical protein